MHCYISVLYLGTTNNWILFFTKILFLRILRLRLKKYFHAILEIHVLSANINIGKVRASLKLQL